MEKKEMSLPTVIYPEVVQVIFYHKISNTFLEIESIKIPIP